jgi:preprotein translocase subunit SecG
LGSFNKTPFHQFKKIKKMKKIIFAIAVLFFVTGITIVSCKPATKEENEATDKAQEANKELLEVKKVATAEEWKAFKNSGDSIINKNEEKIVELKLKMKNSVKSMDDKYEKNIAVLEQKNKDLKVKMETYKNDRNADWQSFKREFNHDMDEIGQALKDLTVDNKK